MAIINCPECGQQVSDNAELCPHCGIRIHGNIVTCPECGEVSISTASNCSRCGHSLVSLHIEETVSTAKKTSSRKTIVVSLCIAFVLTLMAGGMYGYHVYSSSQDAENAWQQLLSDPSSTASAYQLFIDTYPDSEHIQEAEEIIRKLQEEELEWTNALNTGSEKEIQKYIDSHPQSVYMSLAVAKLDSFAWDRTVKENSDAAYEAYLDKFPEGVHSAEAHDFLDNMSKQQLSPTEMAMVKNTFTQFFNALANADEEGICLQVESVMDKFLNITSATKTDVMRFMKAKHADDISTIRYSLNNDYKVTKSDSDGESTFAITFTVDEHIVRSDESKENYANYRINSKLTSVGKILEFTMHKITSRTGE